MSKSVIHKSISFVLLGMSLCSCQDELQNSIDTPEANTEDVINVGVEADGLTISSSMTPLGPAMGTRASEGEKTPAEEIPWLVQPLKQGLDITYGKVDDDPEKRQEKVAILKLSGTVTEGTELHTDGNGNTYAINSKSRLAVYTFNYRGEGTDGNPVPAKWYDNGPHYFEGVHVPNRIRYSSNDYKELENATTDGDKRTINNKSVKIVTGLTTNQSNDTSSGSDDDLSNYYLLSHYLGMPANTRISATVSRILLPFRHRLAHVLAYIIIDPSLATKIKGYENIHKDDNAKPFRDNPETSSIFFCNVDVLAGVKDEIGTDGVHTLTPTWEEKVRKVIPHFKEQASELVVYETSKKKLYPKTEGYDKVATLYKNAYDAAKAGDKSDTDAAKDAEKACGGYTKNVYEAVPVYDLIVRPTYTSYETVMYDEEGYKNETTRRTIAAKKNQIDFQIGLENNLNYEKVFTFDLDANYETTVYLHISREGVDYNSSGSVLWQEEARSDDYYGVDNINGNTLSLAGSSWQRAYYCDARVSGDKVTDGGFYDEMTNTGEDGTAGQYLTETTWKKYFAQAYEGGEHHGDYFVLANDITIDARSLPDDFVFTGHLDGYSTTDNKYHKITLTNAGTPWKEYIETTDYTSEGNLYSDIPEQYSDVEGTVYTLPGELYTKTTHPAVKYTEDELVEIDGTTYVKTSVEYHEAVPAEYYEDEDIVTIDGKTYVKSSVKDNGDETYSLYSDSAEGHDIEAKVGDEKTPAKDAYYSLYTNPTSEQNKPATTETVKTAAWDEYTIAHPTVADVMTGSTTYYTRSGSEDNYVYVEYIKPEKLYRMVQHTSGAALFAGLNGIYSTKQEDDASYTGLWEANVHKETQTINNVSYTYWLPYRDVGDGASNTGWRAEVMNLTVEGGTLFADELFTIDTADNRRTGYSTENKVSGNVDNCKDNRGNVPNHIPAMPKYK